MDKYDQANKLALLLECAENGLLVKDIPSYEGLYAAVSDGRIWSYKKQIFLSPSDNGHGYLYVTLCKKGDKKSKRVNRIIAEVFVPKPEGWDASWDAAHKDDNRHNNHYTNLMWKTRKDNMDTDHFRAARATYGKCPVLCVETGVVYSSQAEAARDLGVCARSISSVVRGHLNTTGGYHFKLVKKAEKAEA